MTSGRRGFFQAIAAAATGTTALAKVEPVIEVPRREIPDSFEHGEWAISWTGYQVHPHSEMIHGFWTAKPKDWGGGSLSAMKYVWGFHGVVASTGGNVGPFHMGDMFTSILLRDEPYVLIDSPQELKNQQREYTLRKLLKYLKENPLADSNNCFRCGPIELREENQKRYGYGY